MCNIIDGPCELAGKYPVNPYHNNPTLHYQIKGILIELFSAGNQLKRNESTDPNYGFKIDALRKAATEKIIAICNAAASQTDTSSTFD